MDSNNSAPLCGYICGAFDYYTTYTLSECGKGIINFGIGLTLREGNREYYYSKLDEKFPGLKDRYVQHYRDSYNLMSSNNSELMKYFNFFCSQYGIIHTPEKCFEYLNEFPEKQEPVLFKT